jgi:hypothetical protein
MADTSIFRKAALDRLASPEHLDERLALPLYSRVVIGVSLLLLATTAIFAAWLLSAA